MFMIMDKNLFTGNNQQVFLLETLFGAIPEQTI
jgi:hypothetical protein